MKKVLLATASVVLISGAAFMVSAQEEGKMGGQRGMMKKGGMLAEMDSNSDGAISKDEFIAHATKRFDETDANKDGKITEDEMKAHRAAEQAKREQHRKEMESMQEKRFMEMDADGDGKISLEEMKKHMESKRGDRGDGPGDDKAPAGDAQ